MFYPRRYQLRALRKPKLRLEAFIDYLNAPSKLASPASKLMMATSLGSRACDLKLYPAAFDRFFQIYPEF